MAPTIGLGLDSGDDEEGNCVSANVVLWSPLG